MSLASENDVRRVHERHFSYLGPEGLALSTFDKFVGAGFAEFVTPDDQDDTKDVA